MSRLGWLAGGVAAAVTASALALVAVQHEYRATFATMQQELERRDRLRGEWRKLQLEQSALAKHGRVERLAREELGMELPERSEIVILERP